MRSWDNEKKDYNYHCNSCKDGKVCGHYTQVSYYWLHSLPTVHDDARLCGGRLRRLAVQWHFVQLFVTLMDGGMHTWWCAVMTQRMLTESSHTHTHTCTCMHAHPHTRSMHACTHTHIYTYTTKNNYKWFCPFRGNIRGQRPYDIKKKCKTICRKCPDKKDLDCENTHIT